MEFSDIDEAIANLEFMKMGFNYFQTGESLVIEIKMKDKNPIWLITMQLFRLKKLEKNSKINTIQT